MPLHAESFCHTNSDSTMISYYDTGKYYKPHIDSTHFTCLIWLFKEPKQFKGGDLKLIPAKETIECVAYITYGYCFITILWNHFKWHSDLSKFRRIIKKFSVRI